LLLANVAIDIASAERYCAITLNFKRGAVILEISFGDKTALDDQFSFHKTIKYQKKRLSQMTLNNLPEVASMPSLLTS